VERAVELLANVREKVVLGGRRQVRVARKIAATLTSTGTLSRYLHPSDALHGDLGMSLEKM